MALPFLCPRKNCKRRFKNTKELTAHVNMMHVRAERISKMLGPININEHMHFQGTSICVPPSQPPSRIVLPCCSKHWVMLVPSCVECAEIINTHQPLCPLTFYSSCVIQKNKRTHQTELINDKDSEISEDNGCEEIILSTGGAVAAWIRLPGEKDDVLVNVIALFRDKMKRKFLAYSCFRGISYLSKNKQIELKPSFDRHYEVLEALEVKFVDLSVVLGSCFVLNCTKQEYHRRRNDGQLPRMKGQDTLYGVGNPACS